MNPINRCLKEGLFPETFKEARIRALYKGTGSRKKSTNYRPISVLSNLAKIFEKLLYLRFYAYFADNELIAPTQFGFLPRSNTTTAALHAISRIQQSLNDRKTTAAVFIDVAKAFDSVDHAQLLRKLEDAGIRGKAHLVMQNYLFARRQRVVSNETHSEDQYTRYGIPQGSCLSSLLFILYVNDCLSLPLHGYIQMYADDTIMIYSCDGLIELHQEIQADLELMNTWMYNNFLSFNAQKTNYMIFRTPRQQQSSEQDIIVNGTVINKTCENKYLGLMIDSDLSWAPHIRFLKNQLFPYLFVLRNARYTLPISTKRSLYFAYIHSHLNYLISIWGYASPTIVQQLQIIQNKAIRSLFWQEYHSGTINTEGLLRKYRIPSVQKLKEIDSLMMIFKIKNDIIKNNMSLQTFENVHQYHTRNRTNFVLPRTRINLLHNSLFSAGLARYNMLPSSIKQIDNLLQFKRSLKSFFLQ